MKVGSDREAATSPISPSRGVDEIGTLAIQILSAGTSKIGRSIGEFTPIKSLVLRWEFPLKINGFLREF